MAPIGRALADTFRLLEPFQRSSDNPALTVEVHVEDLRNFIRSRSSESRAALLGFSWGAMLALAYGAAYPQALGPMILVGCGTFDEASRAVAGLHRGPTSPLHVCSRDRSNGARALRRSRI
jgi:pimeloyl-ACP methyl ester carboxylesterase